MSHTNFIDAIVKSNGSFTQLTDHTINIHGFLEAMSRDNIGCSEWIAADGKVHHFKCYRTAKACWYAFNGTAGEYGDCNDIGGIYGK